MTRLLVLLGVLTGMTSVAVGQRPQPSTDSLLKLVFSPLWQVRDDAVLRLSLMHADQRPSGYAAAVIRLLELEAIDSAPGDNPHPSDSNDGDGEGEGYGEYVLHLVEAVEPLHDPRSLRGLALLGIQTGRPSEEYVASLGDTAIPFLDESWKRGAQDPVATTWAYMAIRYEKALSRGGRLQVLKRLLATDSVNPRAFGWGMINGPFPEAIPLLQDIADKGAPSLPGHFTENFVSRLKPERDQIPGAALLERLGDWTEAFCLDATGSRREACEVLAADASRARRYADSGPADSLTSALQTLEHDAALRASRHDISAIESRLLVGNATYLTGRSWSACRTTADVAASARYSIQQFLAGHEDTTKVVLVTDAKVCRTIMAHYRADSSAIPGIYSGYVFRTEAGYILYLPWGPGIYVVFNPQFRIEVRMGGPE